MFEVALVDATQVSSPLETEEYIVDEAPESSKSAVETQEDISPSTIAP